MLFNSYSFLLLVLLTLGLYYAPFTRRLQVYILILASLIFYAWHYWELTFLLVLSIFVNAFVTKMLLSNLQNKKTWATIGVSINLIVLSLFKYAGLFISTLNSNQELVDWAITIPLPIGISFYTFQGISMVVDAYRGNHDVLASLKSHSNTNIFFYIAFFPQLIAGPIVKAHDFLPQIAVKFLKDVDWQRAIHFLIVGYFLKMVVADNLKDYTFWMEYPYFERRSSFTLISFLLAYSAQIFADFEGYSMIAIGVATLFGYRLHLNFNFPYIAKSFSEFWRRWHISLSSFLKEYLYIPLGGNRKGKFRTYFNLLLTMVLGGLWHGASWSYAVWGLIHGLALAIERLFNDINRKKSNHIIKVFFRWFTVQSIVTLAWLTFKINNFDHVLAYLNSMMNNFLIHDNYKMIGLVSMYILPVVIYHGWALYKEKHNLRISNNTKALVYTLLFYLILVNHGTSSAFIYFQF